MRMRVTRSMLMIVSGFRLRRRRMIMVIEVVDISMWMALGMFMGWSARQMPMTRDVSLTAAHGRHNASGAVMVAPGAKQHGRRCKPLHRKCKGQQAYQDNTQAFKHGGSVEQPNGDWFNPHMTLLAAGLLECIDQLQPQIVNYPQGSKNTSTQAGKNSLTLYRLEGFQLLNSRSRFAIWPKSFTPIKDRLLYFQHAPLCDFVPVVRASAPTELGGSRQRVLA